MIDRSTSAFSPLGRHGGILAGDTSVPNA